MNLHHETELRDTREAIQSEIETLRKRNAELSEKVFHLKGELSDRDSEIAELRATISRRERLGLDNHPEAGPL